MERRYFQLEQGYLNVDEQGLYFTRSGNWQEALAARERSMKQGPAHAGRLVIGIVIILIGGLFLLFGHMSDASDTGSTLVALALSAFGVFSLYRALRHDFGPVFRVPFSKIIALEGPADERLTIRFVNGDAKEDQVSFKVPIEAVPFVLEGLALARG
ncbi:MAG: hypothetical protein IPP26_06905 [Flavobacteriales bacterium]|nr:hypothetical protein [Flavobacteriales bacterium]